MTRTLQRFRVLLALLRAAPGNPLVAANAPWRQPVMVKLFCVLQLLVACAPTLAWMFGLPGVSLSDAAVSAMLIGMPGAQFVLVPVNIVLFMSRWLDPQRLEDLCLTPMTPRETTVGLFFWPVATSLATMSVSLLSALAFALADRGDYPRLRDVGILSAIVALQSLGTLSLMVSLWLRWGRIKWTFILVNPFVLFGGTILAGMLAGSMFAATEMVGNSSGDREAIVAGICCALITPMFLGFGLRNGPALLMRGIDPEAYERHSLMGQEIAGWRGRDNRRAVRALLRRTVAVPWRASVVAVSMVMAVLVPWGFVAQRSDAAATAARQIADYSRDYVSPNMPGFCIDASILFTWLNQRALASIFLLAIVALHVWQRHVARECPLAVSGAFVRGIARRLKPLTILFAAWMFAGALAGTQVQQTAAAYATSYAGMGVPDLPRLISLLVETSLKVASIWVAGMSLAAWLAAMGRWHWILSVGVAVVLGVGLASLMRQPYILAWPYTPFERTGGYERLGDVAYLVCMMLGGTAIAAVLSLFDRSARGSLAGEVAVVRV